jgi:hypothetical protein
MNIMRIKKNGLVGKIKWDDSLTVLKIDFPDPAIIKRLLRFFNSPRTYKVPQSDRIDDYTEEEHRPMEDELWFRASLSDLYMELGIYLIK